MPKYSGKLPVAVRLYPKEGNTILEIEDKGIGILKMKLQLIFRHSIVQPIQGNIQVMVLGWDFL